MDVAADVREPFGGRPLDPSIDHGQFAGGAPVAARDLGESQPVDRQPGRPRRQSPEERRQRQFVDDGRDGLRVEGRRNEVVAGIDDHHDDIGTQRQRDISNAVVVLLRTGAEHTEIDGLHVGTPSCRPLLFHVGGQGRTDEEPFDEAVAHHHGAKLHARRSVERPRPIAHAPVVVDRDEIGRLDEGALQIGPHGLGRDRPEVAGGKGGHEVRGHELRPGPRRHEQEEAVEWPEPGSGAQGFLAVFRRERRAGAGRDAGILG